MSMKRMYVAVAALAIAMSFVAVSQSQAAYRHHRHGGPGTCGENMYWSHGHCRDARDKTG
jgi:hypothetical protein